MKILLVDDTATERIIMSSFLKQLGHEVIIGQNGIEATELYRREKPDLIIMDVIMPVLDGHSAARKIREIDKDWVPIIFLSGKTDPEDIVAGIEAGGDDYLTKPVNQQVLAAKMIAMQRIAQMRHRLIEVSQALEKVNAHLKEQADIDGLTGIANRRHMENYLQRAIRQCARYQQPISVVLLDIDHFKKYNDHYGHLAGDSCLKKVAKVLSRTLQRPGDLACRYGGEEFCLILPDTDVRGAEVALQNVFQAVKNLRIPHADSPTAPVVTFSAGITIQAPNHKDSFDDLISQADQALYQAKNQGRNQYQLHDGTAA